MAWAVLSGFGLSLVAPWLARAARGWAGWLLALLPLGLTLHFARLAVPVATGHVLIERHPWVPGLGVSFSFRADGLSLLFALLITSVGALVVAYSGGYMAHDPQRGRFFAYLLAFMASMLGLVLADNLLLLYVFWELTSITSYLLIGFDHSRAEARSAALTALLVTSAGGLCLLAGLLLLGFIGGSFEIGALTGLAQRPHAVLADPLYAPCLVLILLGAAAKSAQLPFHFWLPAAMAAPAPVSAYLHSATMVNAGIYLLARLHPVLGGSDLFRHSVTSLGAATMLAGAYLAWQEVDLKRILAYSTVSTLGMLVLLVGWGTAASAVAAMLYLVVHAAYKGALFLVTGAVDHATGTRDVTLLGGLRRAMPFTALGALLAALSMIGLPPWIGFLGKELLYEATLGAPALLWMIVAACAVNVLVAGLAVARPFFGQPRWPGRTAPGLPPSASPPGPPSRTPREAPPGMWLGPLILGVTGTALGLAARPLGDTLIEPAAAAVLGRPVPLELSTLHALSLRHGGEPNSVLILGAATIALGILAYILWPMLRRAARPLAPALAWGPARWYEATLSGMLHVAGWQTRLLQNGYLRYYLLVTIVTTIGLVGVALAGTLDWLAWTWEPEVRFHEIVLAAVLLAATGVAARSRSRMAAVAALGVVGYIVALLFLLFGAPDLAMTQFAIETLTVILLVLVMHRLPAIADRSSTATRVRDLTVAAAGGAVMTALVLMVTAAPTPSRLSSYFVEHSLSQGHGRNVVNVLLVDFRALDTLGEITVLAVAAIGGYGLLELRPREPR